ncbi:hypothetical protein [Bradyrhizobium sp. CCBAU 11357]|uniref:hypothetical protein n=1 Tax=Bradyrhizobium sp. CCBAU 11357 TaxID=1630808 RepID=UPI0023037E9D|nr:hypothetical protein [Bradyrhizobium sp. CCBAU 11357]
MTRQPDPVFAGLAEGLRPRAVAPEPETITLDIDAIRADERFRIIQAVESLAETAEHQLAAQLRTANAAERLANSIETLVGLFASCVGRGSASGPGQCSSDPWTSEPVNYFRASSTGNSFKPDRDGDDDE